jgi:hypothetical protein
VQPDFCTPLVQSVNVQNNCTPNLCTLLKKAAFTDFCNGESILFGILYGFLQTPCENCRFSFGAGLGYTMNIKVRQGAPPCNTAVTAASRPEKKADFYHTFNETKGFTVHG